MADAKKHRISLATAEAKFQGFLDKLTIHKRDMEDYEDFLHDHQTSLRRCVAITSETQEQLDRGVPVNNEHMSVLQVVEAIYERLRQNTAAIRLREAQLKRFVDDFDELVKRG